MNKPSSDTQNYERDVSLARRRLLLKGAKGGSAAALAALSPVGALATGSRVTVVVKDGKTYHCTVSGVRSASHSFGSNIVQVPCRGKKLTYWCKKTWSSGSYKPTNTWPCDYTPAMSPYWSKCRSGWTGRRWFETTYMTDSTDSDESHWICAHLNSLKFYSTQEFPYSYDDVKAMYNGTYPGVTSAEALTFFKTYLAFED